MSYKTCGAEVTQLALSQSNHRLANLHTEINNNMPDVVNENINNNNTTSTRIRGAPHDLRATCAQRKDPNSGNECQNGQNWPWRLRQRSPPLARHPKMLTNHRGRRRRRNYYRPGYLHSYANPHQLWRNRAWTKRVGHKPHGHPAYEKPNTCVCANRGLCPPCPA